MISISYEFKVVDTINAVLKEGQDFKWSWHYVIFLKVRHDPSYGKVRTKNEWNIDSYQRVRLSLQHGS